MKIFLSHQKQDSEVASRIASRLRIWHSIDCYLDVIDPLASQTGDLLGEYIRAQLSTCSQLMAVVSEYTKTSWWVPWEIGIATEKDYPISTYAAGNCELPIYLKKWPYLKSDADLDTYAKISKDRERDAIVKQAYLKEAEVRARTTREFHQSLKRALGQ
jgi:TIR domain